MTIIDPPLGQKFMLVPAGNVFTNAMPGSAIVVHKTASGSRAEDIAHFFQNDPNHASSHFVVGQDGVIVQSVHLWDGAGANCCVEPGYDPWWQPLLDRFGNLNTCTISIEVCDPKPDNSTPLTAAQKASTFRLIKWLVQQYGLNPRTEIKGHNTIDPINRARDPGNFPWNELYAYLEGASPPVPPERNTAAMEKQFRSVWFAGPNAWESGIFHMVLHAFLDGKLAACYAPVGEIASNDWGGNPVILCPLSTGDYAVWWPNNGTGKIYTNRNQVIYG